MLSFTQESVLARVVCMSERKGEKLRLWFCLFSESVKSCGKDSEVLEDPQSKTRGRFQALLTCFPIHFCGKPAQEIGETDFYNVLTHTHTPPYPHRITFLTLPRAN